MFFENKGPFKLSYIKSKCAISGINSDGKVNDIKGLTSIIEACDFVITCSNINAHLSGALGIKTFLLLPLGKGRLWNWNFENQRSIWYPSVKIFQQETQGKWKDPILKLEKEVKKCLNV